MQKELTPYTEDDPFQKCPYCGHFAQSFGLFSDRPLIFNRFFAKLFNKSTELAYFLCWNCGCKYTRPYRKSDKNNPDNWPYAE